MKIGIIGYGEIGSSIAKVYESFDGYDVRVVDPYQNRNDDIEGVEVLNICIPFIDEWIAILF